MFMQTEMKMKSYGPRNRCGYSKAKVVVTNERMSIAQTIAAGSEQKVGLQTGFM